MEDAINKFLNVLYSKDRSQETIIGYRKDLTYFKNYLEEKYNYKLYLKDISVEIIEEYLIYIKDVKKLAPRSRSRFVYCIKSFYKQMYKLRIVSENLGEFIDNVKLPKVERKFIYLNDAKEIINNIENLHIKAILTTMLFTGMRISETITLKITNIDFQNNLIYILAAKGNKDRIIPLNSILKTYLKYYIENTRITNKNNDFLFPSIRGEHYTIATVNSNIRKATKNLNYNDHKISSHDYRHCWASEVAKRGVPIQVIQKILGHENIRTTSIYLHSSLDEMAEAINKIT